ncbi:DUF3276 family protein [Marinifilum sp. RC60d5]|uniref:DUF3276 family protein n=1 Tax=Marinifilum sp. RC60d5 TaxID=3458414 RepID=UPI0040364434
MEGYDKKEGFGKNNREEIFSNAVRAGKRTYFFDVKATRKNDYYLTITESKKRYEKDGSFSFEKHKVFLYKEDFDKFSDGLLEALDFIRSSNHEMIESEETDFSSKTNHLEKSELIEGLETEAFSNLEFEDLSE